MLKYKLLFIAVILNISVLVSAPIDIQTAKIIGSNFLSQPITDIKIGCSFQSTTAYYILNSDSGFVIVAGDDVINPIIGYSYNSLTNNNGELPDNMKEWLDNKAKQIHYAVENNTSVTNEIKQRWESLLSSSKENNKFQSVVVGPLIKTKWGQTTRYNVLTPGNSPTGCVATAMAQIMKYWEWPVKGTGDHCYTAENYQQKLCADFGNTTYQWKEMPEKLNSNSNTNEINAISELMYHCGVAVEMKYGENSSGAFDIGRISIKHNKGDTNTIIVFEDRPCILEAFPKYFGYKTTIEPLLRFKYIYNLQTNTISEKPAYTTEEWIILLKQELDSMRPIVYSGESSSAGAHTFICDGYDTDNFFHLNWGWSGKYDGYYNIDDLEPIDNGVTGPYGNFNYQERVIIGIKPNIEVKVTGILLSPKNINASIGDSSIKLQYTILPVDATNQEVMWKSNDTNVATVSSSGMISFVGSGETDIEVKTDDGGFTDKCHIIVVNNVLENYNLDNIVISPNPTNDKINIMLNLETSANIRIILNDLLGNELNTIYDGFVYVGSFTKTFSTANLPKGIYYLKIFIDNKVKIEKVVVIK
jgi:uncharacterized protein YjdB